MINGVSSCKLVCTLLVDSVTQGGHFQLYVGMQGIVLCPLQEVLDRKRRVYKQLQKIEHQNTVKLIKYICQKNKYTNQELGSKGV